MPYSVHYQDVTGRVWDAFFNTQEEALDQAAMGVVAYGDTAPQAVLDDTGTVVHDQAAIIAEARKLTG